MAELVCRSCGGAVQQGATVCPHCGATDPIVASVAGDPDATTRVPSATADTEPPARTDDPARGPAPERTVGSRVTSAVKAIGCLVLALIVLAIAILVGVFDFLF